MRLMLKTVLPLESPRMEFQESHAWTFGNLMRGLSESYAWELGISLMKFQNLMRRASESHAWNFINPMRGFS